MGGAHSRAAVAYGRLRSATSRLGRGVRGRKGAACLCNDIECEPALGEYDDRLENIGEQALALLEKRFPGVREAARQIEEPPSLSRRAGDALHGVRRTPRQRPAAWPRKRVPRVLSRHSLSRPCGCARAHPVRAVAMVAVFTIVIVNVWPSVAFGLMVLAAIRFVDDAF